MSLSDTISNIISPLHGMKGMIAVKNWLFSRTSWGLLMVDPKLKIIDNSPSRLPFDISEVEKESQAESSLDRILQGQIQLGSVLQDFIDGNYILSHINEEKNMIYFTFEQFTKGEVSHFTSTHSSCDITASKI